ncbi:hypothetical protein SAMN04487948_11184 [Halogranum amylolyticum]|uniref:Uncharacterized protein n=1 Tax=Halogranum amylolyticum TaxID=660520 RepID=A0A1H8UK39_9EURY|nr:hypothetical protein [Halogranum amylolyticum]SEP03333.1 hypothetical protein SAMN04487948_11184 [Halogranum amylolyticum]
MPFDDLADENNDENNDETEETGDPGNEALGELAGTLSGSDSGDDSTGADSESDNSYNPETDPAFPTAKSQTQHSVYCLPKTWETLDGPSGLLFEAEIALRRNGYGAVQKRELHNAFLQAAVNELSVEDITDRFIATRDERVDGPLLDD